MDKNQAQKKLIKQLKRTNKDISETETTEVLVGFERLINLVTKITTEPQARFKVRKFKLSTGKQIQRKVTEFGIEELKKVRDKTKKKEDLLDLVRKVHKVATRDKYDR